jgi:hypothetical protein
MILEKIQAKFPTAQYAVVFLNMDFNSSQFGAWTVLPVGPDQTVKTLEECSRIWLNDLPSQRQYPVAYVEIKKEG